MARRSMISWLVLAVAACAPASQDSSTFTLVELSSEEALTSAAEQYAEQNGVSVEVAKEALLAQAEVSETATFLRSNTPGYAGFKFVHEPPNVYGVVAVTDPTRVNLIGHPEISVVKARIAESEFLAYDTRLRAALAADGFGGIIGVMYDAFEDEFIVWLPSHLEDYSAAELDARTASVLEELGPQFAGVGVRFDHSEGRLGMRVDTDPTGSGTVNSP